MTTWLRNLWKMCETWAWLDSWLKRQNSLRQESRDSCHMVDLFVLQRPVVKMHMCLTYICYIWERRWSPQALLTRSIRWSDMPGGEDRNGMPCFFMPQRFAIMLISDAGVGSSAHLSKGLLWGKVNLNHIKTRNLKPAKEKPSSGQTLSPPLLWWRERTHYKK